MRRIAAFAALAAGLVLSGCSGHQQAGPLAEIPLSTATTAPATVPSSPLPAPEALTDVLYRLSDPAVPGTEKIALIEGAKPTDAETIDKFATALKDGGYLPLNLEAAGVAWSERYPGYATADITINTANPATGGFSFPMQFKPDGAGWQLSQETAKALLTFGKSQAGSSSATAVAPPTP